MSSTHITLLKNKIQRQKELIDEQTNVIDNIIKIKNKIINEQKLEIETLNTQIIILQGTLSDLKRQFNYNDDISCTVNTINGIAQA